MRTPQIEAFTSDPEGVESGSFEVFWGEDLEGEDGETLEPGWYWWAYSVAVCRMVSP
jgi:hypothetical protein